MLILSLFGHLLIADLIALGFALNIKISICASVVIEEFILIVSVHGHHAMAHVDHVLLDASGSLELLIAE